MGKWQLNEFQTEEETREEGSSIESIVSNLVLLIDHPHVHSQTMQVREWDFIVYMNHTVNTVRHQSQDL